MDHPRAFYEMRRNSVSRTAPARHFRGVEVNKR